MGRSGSKSNNIHNEKKKRMQKVTKKSKSSKAETKKVKGKEKPQNKKIKTVSSVGTSKSVITRDITIYQEQADYFSLDLKYKECGFATRAIHAGNQPDEITGGVAPSIDLSTTFAQLAPGIPSSCFDYARCGNPTRLALERNLASMEKANYAFALNSGMSATVSVINLLQQGDHILCVDDVYGGTQRYLKKILLPNSGIDITMIDMSKPSDVAKGILSSTKLVWLETPTNPTLKCFDIAAISRVCKEKGVLFVVDNTFMSPALQNPLVLGADIVVNSITKYIGGHSDVIAGAICLNDKELYSRLMFITKSIGSGISAFDAWVALRGSKTLDLRITKAMENAEIIAKMLDSHPKISKVIYPGLSSHPQHKVAKKNVHRGKGGSGMISFYIDGDIKKANRFLKSLKLITLAESLGGVESLIESPALMTHGSVPPEHRKLLGIEDNFIRLSTGIEDADDLISDLQNALTKA